MKDELRIDLKKVIKTNSEIHLTPKIVAFRHRNELLTVN